MQARAHVRIPVAFYLRAAGTRRKYMPHIVCTYTRRKFISHIACALCLNVSEHVMRALLAPLSVCVNTILMHARILCMLHTRRDCAPRARIYEAPHTQMQ